MGRTRRRSFQDEETHHLAMSDDDDEKAWERRSSGESIYEYSRDTSCESSDNMLPGSPIIRARSYYQYRIPNRTMRWICISIMAIIILFILNLTRMGMNSADALEALREQRPPPPPPVFESFPFLKRYFGGIRSIVPRPQSIREYPTDNITLIPSKEARKIPMSQPYKVFSEYQRGNRNAVECFLDENEKIRIPQIHNYKGVPQGMPENVMGSSLVMNISEQYCFDRYGKLSPYGFGYTSTKGGIGAGLEGERENAEEVWAEHSPIDYSRIQWHDVQNRCFEKNKHRFAEVLKKMNPEPWQTMPMKRDQPLRNETTTTLTPRTAFIIRTWDSYKYTPEVILYLRSLISEIALTSAGEYTVHFLVHVKNDNEPIWADTETYNRVLNESLPEEFHGMATLWTERQMLLIYGGLPDSFYYDLPVHGVYRSAHFPLQYFAHQHPEYDYFWNWEMDVRYTGHLLNLLEKSRSFAQAQPRKGLWERNERFYVPEIHGSWEDFKHMVRVQSEMPPPAPVSKWAKVGPPGSVEESLEVEKPIWGSKPPAEDFQSLYTDPIPPTTYEKDHYTWGVGEEADLITFSPIFDPVGTDWELRGDLTGYPSSTPKRTSIITTSRFSRRLLSTMYNTTVFHHQTMFVEMFPPSIALHHGYKPVFVPHSIYIDRAWPLPYLAKVMNGGKNGAVGGSRASVYGQSQRHNLRGVSWYYDDGFAGNLWRRWLGYRVNGDGGESEEVAGEGRMCLPAMLLHPVKDVGLVVEDDAREKEEME